MFKPNYKHNLCIFISIYFFHFKSRVTSSRSHKIVDKLFFFDFIFT